MILTDTVYEARVIDKGDFNTVLRRRLFAKETTARGWAEVEQTAARDRLKAAYPGSPQYDIDAIVAEINPRDFDPS